MKHIRLRFVFVYVLTLLYLAAFVIGSQDTYAWFTSKTTASGQITNASRSDLLQITGDIQYEDNCQLRSTVTIKNISTISILIRLELTSKSGGSYVSKTLQPNESFISNQNNTANLITNCHIKEVKYDFTALDAYIDEPFIITVDQEKLKATVKQEKKETIVDQGKPKATDERMKEEESVEKEKSRDAVEQKKEEAIVDQEKRKGVGEQERIEETIEMKDQVETPIDKAID